MNPWNSENEQPALVSSVLVVDDERLVREVLVRALEAEDLAVTAAATSEEALELLAERRFDLLVTDKNLPGMGGLELIAEARRRRPTLEAIMITGYGSAESVLTAMANGASDYMLKPFRDLRVVRAKVRAALARREGQLQVRERARADARVATELLKARGGVPDEAWETLDRTLRHYEAFDRAGAFGTAFVHGKPELVKLLTDAGITAVPLVPEVGGAVVVVDTEAPGWHDTALALKLRGADVIAVANPKLDLPDLLEAVGAGLSLVGFGGPFPPKGLPEKVRTLLLHRRLEKAQAELARAVEVFRRGLDAAA